MKSVVRQLYKVKTLKKYRTKKQEMSRTDNPEKATLRSSEIKQVIGHGRIARTLLILKEDENLHAHAPALDIDGINCVLKPSSTEGNFHLYIDKPMSWDHYRELLGVLYKVGIIEDGF